MCFLKSTWTIKTHCSEWASCLWQDGRQLRTSTSIGQQRGWDI